MVVLEAQDAHAALVGDVYAVVGRVVLVHRASLEEGTGRVHDGTRYTFCSTSSARTSSDVSMTRRASLQSEVVECTWMMLMFAFAKALEIAASWPGVFATSPTIIGTVLTVPSSVASASSAMRLSSG